MPGASWVGCDYCNVRCTVSTVHEPDLTAKLGEYGPQFMAVSVRGNRARLHALDLFIIISHPDSCHPLGP
jgi:hypothetical protein